MKLTEWRKIVGDGIYYDYDMSIIERVGHGMTLADIVELAVDAAARPTVDHIEDERIIRTLAAALVDLAERHKK